MDFYKFRLLLSSSSSFPRWIRSILSMNVSALQTTSTPRKESQNSQLQIGTSSKSVAVHLFILSFHASPKSGQDFLFVADPSHSHINHKPPVSLRFSHSLLELKNVVDFGCIANSNARNSIAVHNDLVHPLIAECRLSCTSYRPGCTVYQLRILLWQTNALMTRFIEVVAAQIPRSTAPGCTAFCPVPLSARPHQSPAQNFIALKWST